MNIAKFGSTINFIAALLFCCAGYKFYMQRMYLEQLPTARVEDAIAHVQGSYYGNRKSDPLQSLSDEAGETRNYFLLGGVITLIIGVGLVGSAPSEKAPIKTRECPHCAETIKSEAKVCRFCQREVV